MHSLGSDLVHCERDIVKCGMSPFLTHFEVTQYIIYTTTLVHVHFLAHMFFSRGGGKKGNCEMCYTLNSVISTLIMSYIL